MVRGASLPTLKTAIIIIIISDAPLLRSTGSIRSSDHPAVKTRILSSITSRFGMEVYPTLTRATVHFLHQGAAFMDSGGFRRLKKRLADSPPSEEQARTDVLIFNPFS